MANRTGSRLPPSGGASGASGGGLGGVLSGLGGILSGPVGAVLGGGLLGGLGGLFGGRSRRPLTELEQTQFDPIIGRQAVRNLFAGTGGDVGDAVSRGLAGGTTIGPSTGGLLPQQLGLVQQILQRSQDLPQLAGLEGFSQNVLDDLLGGLAENVTFRNIPTQSPLTQKLATETAGDVAAQTFFQREALQRQAVQDALQALTGTQSQLLGQFTQQFGGIPQVNAGPQGQGIGDLLESIGGGISGIGLEGLFANTGPENVGVPPQNSLTKAPPQSGFGFGNEPRRAP